jgi:hypothetical protein
MRIDRVETLRADAAWRSFSFLKISTACGVTGWGADIDEAALRARPPKT